MVSANKVATVCSIDILYYFCYVVLLKLVRCPGAANTSLGGSMLVSPALCLHRVHMNNFNAHNLTLLYVVHFILRA
jgi:hypothetical protein